MGIGDSQTHQAAPPQELLQVKANGGKRCFNLEQLLGLLKRGLKVKEEKLPAHDGGETPENLQERIPSAAPCSPSGSYCSISPGSAHWQ